MTDDFKERRHSNGEQATVLLIKELADQVKELKAAVADLKRANSYTHGVTQEFLEKAVRHAMEEAFPNGDGIGHRKAHEQWLDERNARREMWAKVRSGLLEKALWSLVIGLGVLVSFYFSGIRIK